MEGNPISRNSVVRLGTRGSKLALAQANSVKALLESSDPDIFAEIVTIRTSGDKGDRDKRGAFVREIQEALLDNSIDIALHCLKDLPTGGVTGLVFGAHLEREDPRDTIITRGKSWTDLKSGSVVGTGSVRRTSQLIAHRKDLNFKPLVGNVDTRLRKLQEGEYDAIVLAIAGIKRLGLLETWSESPYADLTWAPLDTNEMLPAPGQAILVLETREADRHLVQRFNHAPTEAAGIAERAFLRRFGGGCSVPVAALAVQDGPSLVLHGLVAAPDGSQCLRGVARGSADIAEPIGTRLANELGERGAFTLFPGAQP